MEVDLDDNFEQNVTLKLRKNRRIDSRWGAQYFVAVHDTVFGLQHLPYMPMEPPASLSEEIVESDPLHVCKQCKDCFRFQSSYEDHNKRRSWILGFWCYNCFVTNCTHTNKTQIGSKCLSCKKQDIDKRSYLRSRGLTRKNQKLGAVKVFYNQCQFFEHMKIHGLNIVDMGDIMLMPLPAKISNEDWSLELEIICEALMEHTFLLRTHIMDWLRLNNVEDKWWKLVNGKTNNSLIEKIVEGYQGRQLFKALDKSTINQFVDFFDNKNKDTSSHSANTISDKNMPENEDNPCMSTDIAFVDCGPTSQYFEPESSVSYVPRKHNSYESMTTKPIQNAKKLLTNTRKNNKRKNASLKNLNLLETNMTSENTTTNKTQSLKSYKIQTHRILGNNTEKPIVKPGLSKTTNNSTKVSVPLSANRIILPKINVDPLEQHLQTSNSNTKILTIQSPKDADITSIINQLPSHLISNRKLVVMKQDSNNIIVEVNAVKETKKSGLDNSNTDSVSSQTKTCDSINIKKQQVADKIIIRNGKKYLIKHSRNGTENSENSSNLSIESALKTVKGTTSEHSTSTSTNNSGTVQNINVEQLISLQNDISFINFTSFSSELPSSSKCDSPVKKPLNASNLRKVPPHLTSVSSEKPAEEFLFETISIIPKKDNLFMQIKIVDRLTQNNYRDNYGIVLKYRDDMINDFQRLNSFELKKRIEHLQHVNEEIMKVLNFVSHICLKEKLRAVNTIKHTLERCLDKCKISENIRNKNDDWLLNDWESKVTKTLLCSQCNKFMKSKSYIPGFSKFIKDDDKYCLCYKEVCGECLSYQETQSQLVAHQNLHRKRKPYICPDCHVSFSSSKSLEIHLWTVCFHKLKKRMFSCKICQIDGFRDMESITRHFVIMHSYTYIACGDCLQIFRSPNEYVQHCTEVHSLLNSKGNPVRLVICKLGDFAVRYENYMSYLKMHPGIKKILWFKCPFCPLVTLKHKHLTEILISHLRSKHLFSLSKMYSMEILNDMFGPEISTSKLNTQIVTGTNSSLANKVPCRYTDTLIPKIVNTRTISSEIFEHGSQNTEDTGIIHFDERTDVIKPITEKVDEEKEESYKLPKILDIRSMADLEPSISKQIETKERSQSSQIKVIKIEAEKEDPLAYKEKTTTKELNDSKVNYKEETEESKSNSKSISSCVSRKTFERPSLTDADDARMHSSTELDKEIPDSEFRSTDGRIKVIDIRKMCKPDIEPLLAVELCETKTRNKNANYMTFIPKPPPLTRMPQHLFQSTKANEPNDQSKISEKSFAHRMTDELKEDVQEKDVDYLCRSCNEQINTSWPMVRAHFREKHSHEYTLMTIATPQLLRMSPDFINGGYKQFIGSKKRKSDSALYMSKKKRRWTSKKHTEMKEMNAPIGLCVERETAEDGEGNFKCKKCDQRCTDMANLREHIAANHRLKGRYLICLECGENFVVAPSLQMHLKAFHGIEDPINYMSQNPSYALDIDSDSEAEGRTTVANQCHVCMAVFEDKAAVDKHLRVHGMAFLNRKRIEARNAMKSPEKKISSEEAKQSTIKDSPKKTIKPAETILKKLNAAI